LFNLLPSVYTKERKQHVSKMCVPFEIRSFHNCENWDCLAGDSCELSWAIWLKLRSNVAPLSYWRGQTISQS